MNQPDPISGDPAARLMLAAVAMHALLTTLHRSPNGGALQFDGVNIAHAAVTQADMLLTLLARPKP